MTLVTMASLKPSMLMTVTHKARTMAMVTLEARVMMKIGDASKLEGIQTVTDTPIVDSDEAQMMGL